MSVFLLQILAIVSSLAAVSVSFATFRRAGQWRNSDDGRQISETISALKTTTVALQTDLRATAESLSHALASDEGGGSTLKSDIHKIKNEITKIDIRLTTAEKASDKVSAIEGRITGIETTLTHMASRADIESVKAELGGVEQLARNVQAGVNRIETFLMERAG
jgi:hypothetical protein